MEDILISGTGTYTGHVIFRPSLDALPSFLDRTGPVYLVYDRNVYPHAVTIGQAVGLTAELGLDVSEEDKDISTVTRICTWLLENGADRNALLLAVGGGILTDMAGFAAAIYKRGIKTAYVPTSLLAQVDASVGGKTGVNFLGYKNMLGVIRQPEFTYICPEVLKTLPYGHLLEGAAEMVKTFVIKDDGNYSKTIDLFAGLHAARDRDLFMSGALPSLEELVCSSVSVKAEIVSGDQFETGERRKLNLGHTFAHAIEWCSHRISHGQAVSIGMVCAARLSEAAGIGSPGLAGQIARDLEKCGLPTLLPFPLDRLGVAMLKDKKAEDGRIYFVLPAGIGDVRIVPMPVGRALDLMK